MVLVDFSYDNDICLDVALSLSRTLHSMWQKDLFSYNSFQMAIAIKKASSHQNDENLWFLRSFLYYSCIMWTIVWIQSDSYEDVNGENIWSDVSEWVRFSLEWANFNANWLMLNAVGSLNECFYLKRENRENDLTLQWTICVCTRALYECKRSNTQRGKLNGKRMKERKKMSRGTLTENHKQFTVCGTWKLIDIFPHMYTVAYTSIYISRQCLPFKCSCVAVWVDSVLFLALHYLYSYIKYTHIYLQF